MSNERVPEAGKSEDDCRQFRSGTAAHQGEDAARLPEVDLDVLNGHLGYLMRRAQLWMVRDFNRRVTSLGVGAAQYSVLVVIGANPGLSQMAVSRALGIERGRLVHVLDSLEARQLIQRRKSMSRHSHALHLTPAGRAALNEAKLIGQEHEKYVAQWIGPEQRERLLRLLRGFAFG